MRLLSRTREAGEKVEDARRQVDIALSQMAAALDKVQVQVELAKEEIDERRAGE